MDFSGLSKKIAKQWGKAKLLPNSSFMPAAADLQVGSSLKFSISTSFSY